MYFDNRFIWNYDLSISSKICSDILQKSILMAERLYRRVHSSYPCESCASPEANTISRSETKHSFLFFPYFFPQNFNMGQTLSEPITAKESSSVQNVQLKVGSSCMQGWRISMEDAHTHILKMSEDGEASFFGGECIECIECIEIV